jgi:hypothetical protein
MVTLYDLSGRVILKNRASETELIMDNGEPIAPEVPDDEQNQIGSVDITLNSQTFLPCIYHFILTILLTYKT